MYEFYGDTRFILLNHRRLFLQPFRSSITGEHMRFAVVRGTDKGTAFHIIKAEFVADLAEFSKFVGVYKALNA